MNNDISLRQIKVEDAEILMELNNNEEITKYVVGQPIKTTLERQVEWILNLGKEKDVIRFIILWKNISVGMISLSNIDYLNFVCKINIKILPNYQGNGIAKCAIKLVCNYAFDHLKMELIVANVLEYNIKSQKVFQSLGFTNEGILKKRVIKKGERYDLVSLSLSRGNFKGE